MVVKTYTKVITYARAMLLQMNIMTALKNALGNQYIDANYANNIQKAIDNQWVKTFTLYGEKNGTTVCELILNIDWKTHKVELKKQANIQHDPHWQSDGTLNEVSIAVNAFKNTIQGYHLQGGLVMTIADGVDVKMVHQALGWKTAKPRKRATGLVAGYDETNPALRELNIQFLIDENL